ncbi:MAG: hypothetical protein K9M51_00695 [Candidatus Gracilibacteria bacterium]|nr:hypothetical protein [Candidatus Gracilibacteria bacterium]
MNHCKYCGHSAENKKKRSTLSPEEMEEDFSVVLQFRPQEFCVLAGEHPGSTHAVIAAIQILNKLNPVFGNPLRQISLNVAPLEEAGFRKIIENSNSNVPLQFRVFQETYDRESYTENHPTGPKSDFRFRYHAQTRAMNAGFASVGIGALLGINLKGKRGNDVEILSLIQHACVLQELTGKLPASVAIPRVQHMPDKTIEHGTRVDDETYIFYLSLLRLALPETKIYITARETESFILSVENIVNVRDLAPRPAVGGNLSGCNPNRFQNILGDQRSATAILDDLQIRGKY